MTMQTTADRIDRKCGPSIALNHDGHTLLIYLHGDKGDNAYPVDTRRDTRDEWLTHLCEKAWMTNEMLGALVRAYDIIGEQRNATRGTT